MVVRRRVLLSGRVQGVFFRENCRRQAEARRICGWVRNLNDGRVEAVFEGPAEDVDQLIGWCRVGPPRATVLAVDVADEPVRGERSFRILACD